MRIVIGRGRRREVVEVPTGAIVREAKHLEGKKFVENVCGLLGVK